MGVRDDRLWRRADAVAADSFRIAWIIHSDRHRNKGFVDEAGYFVVCPHIAFHDATRNAPVACEEKNHGLSIVGRVSLGFRVVRRPRHAIGRYVEAVPSVGER